MWVPFAERRPVSLRSSQYRINPAGLVYHTAVSNATVLTPTGVVRWHFYNNKWGKLYQFFDTTVSAACQLDGNYWRENGKPFGFLSMESWDGAGTSHWPDYRTNHNGGPAWTDDQMETNEKLAYIIHEEHGIDLRLATGARGSGFGYHRLFTNTYPYEWNRSHACPGNKRANQVPIVIRNAKPDEEEDEMKEADFDRIKEIVDSSLATSVMNENIPTGTHLDKGTNPGRPLGWHLRVIRFRIDALADFLQKDRKILANHFAEGSQERRAINQEIADLKSALEHAIELAEAENK